MSFARQSHTASVLLNGTVLVTGGANSASYLSSAELYNPATGVWTTTGSMSAPRQYHTASVLPNGKVLITGGFDYVQHLNSTELYDPATGQWESEDDMEDYRIWHTASMLTNGNILIAAGSDEVTLGNSINTAELYNSTAKTLTSLNLQSSHDNTHDDEINERTD